MLLVEISPANDEIQVVRKSYTPNYIEFIHVFITRQSLCVESLMIRIDLSKWEGYNTR